MKAEWIVYGPNKEKDSGWQVLGQSSGIKTRDTKDFVSFCNELPIPDNVEKGYCVYFGKISSRKNWLCFAEYIGEDSFGRSGAWMFYGFLVPPGSAERCAYRLTEKLRSEKLNFDSQAPLNFEGIKPQRPTQHGSKLAALFNEKHRLVFAIPDDNLEKAGEAVDNLLSASSAKQISYAFPINTKSGRFDIIGTPILNSTEAGGIIPLRQPDAKSGKRKFTKTAMVLFVITGMMLGFLGGVQLQYIRGGDREYLRSELDAAEKDVRELKKLIDDMKHQQDKKSRKLVDIVSRKSVDIDFVMISTTNANYTFSGRTGNSIVRNLNKLFDKDFAEYMNEAND